MKRREFLRLAPALPLAAACAARPSGRDAASGVVVNDVHSGLNATRVRAIHHPSGVGHVERFVRAARRDAGALAVSGSRHAMGGQQFARGAPLIDLRGANRILRFDRDRGLLEVQAGAEWPEVIDWLLAEQGGRRRGGLGDSPEADRRRPLDDRGLALGEHSRTRTDDAAIHQRHRGSDGRQWTRSDDPLQPYGKS